MSEKSAEAGGVVRIDDWLWRIRLPTPFPGLPSINIYVAHEDDGSVTLIEAGIDVPGALDLLSVGLHATGRDLRDVTRIVPTHGHLDHWGLVPTLSRHADFSLVMSEHWEFEAWFYGDPAAVIDQLADVFVAGGVPAAEAPELAGVGRDQQSFADGVPVPDVLLADGDTIDIAGRTFDVVWVPGHAQGHVCLHHPESGILFSGDHVLPSITPVVQFLGQTPDPLGDFMRSLDKVGALEMSLIFPAHGSTIEAPRRRVKQLRAHHERRLSVMLGELRHGASTALDVMEAVFRPNLLDFSKRLALSETMAHLEMLKVDGLVSRGMDDDGAWRYTPS